MKKIVMYLSFVAVLVSCNHKNAASDWEEKSNSLEFDSIVSLNTYPVIIKEVMDIKEWNIIDTILICRNRGDHPSYYVFNTTNFQVIGEFGRTGNGENEWISPHLIPRDESVYTVIDNVRLGIYDVVKEDSLYAIQKKKDLVAQIPLNSVKPVSSSAFAYITHSPKEVSWKIADIETLASVDSLSFSDSDENRNALLRDFSYGVTDDHAVFAFQRIDRFMISSLSDSHHVIPGLIMQGDGDDKNRKDVYYTDVICRDYIYLLSQRDVRTSELSGTSSIEVYDYDGNPVRKISIDIIASEMVYDPINKRVIFRTPMDNDFHVLDYAFE